ncbi:MAG: fumarylacetoacetate hydrolase family protein [Acidobacteria bacterium]|nr:fumarylacetoacetate hydrolase family protein [Acidobacteriota bacterium]
MRYVTLSTDADPTPRLGVVHGDQVADVRSLPVAPGTDPWPSALLDFIRQGPAAWRRLADRLARELPRGDGTWHRADEIRWHAPIPRVPKNIFCLGLNYASHAMESAQARGREPKIPQIPVFFTKAPTTVSGPFDEIPWDRGVTQQVDWEAELGVIIGASGRNIPRARAREHVFGYTAVNDLTARDLQQQHLQWFKGKSLDGFCPMGPLVVTADEFGDPQAKQIALRVNGQVKQLANTKDMIFGVDAIIEVLSRGLTLEPGDVISTGTPEGVGIGRTPPEFLQDGDVVETEIEGIGTMRNCIVAVS